MLILSIWSGELVEVVAVAVVVVAVVVVEAVLALPLALNCSFTMLSP